MIAAMTPKPGPVVEVPVPSLSFYVAVAVVSEVASCAFVVVLLGVVSVPEASDLSDRAVSVAVSSVVSVPVPAIVAVATLSDVEVSVSDTVPTAIDVSVVACVDSDWTVSVVEDWTVPFVEVASVRVVSVCELSLSSVPSSSSPPVPSSLSDVPNRATTRPFSKSVVPYRSSSGRLLTVPETMLAAVSTELVSTLLHLPFLNS